MDLLFLRPYRWFKRRHPLAKILLVLVFAEMLAQIFMPNLKEYAYFQIERGEGAMRNFEEDPDLFWTPPDRFASIDKLAEQTAPQNRLLFFGGSVVYGFGDQGSFPAALQEQLDADPARKNLRAINYAFMGYSSEQSKVQAERKIPRYPARLVFVSHGSNDIMRRNFDDRFVRQENAQLSRHVLHLFTHSKLFCLYRRVLLSGKANVSEWQMLDTGGTVRVSPAQFRENLMAMAALAKTAGAKVVLMSHENALVGNRQRQEPYWQVMEELATTDANVTYIDVRPFVREIYGGEPDNYLSEPDPKRHLFVDSVHFNKRGNRLVGEFLYRELVARGLLD